MVSSAITVTVKQFPWVCCCLVALCLSVNKSANHDAALHSNTQAMDCKATHCTLQRNLIYRSNSTSPYCLVMVFLSSSSAPPWRVTLACHHHYFIDKTFMTQPKIQKRSAATATLPPCHTACSQLKLTSLGHHAKHAFQFKLDILSDSRKFFPQQAQ